MRPVTVTTANAWRWKYPRPPDVHSPGVEAATWLRDTLITQRADKSRKDQLRLKRQFGFPGGKPEIGHAVAFELRRQGYSRTTAQLGGHLAAVSGPWNFQGNRRLAFWVGVSERTVRRHRAELEQSGLIGSHLLLPGDQVLGQRCPVIRPQVVRDVTKLQRLANVRAAAREPRKGHKERRSSAAEQPPAAAAPSAEDFAELARRNPEFSAMFQALAAQRRARDIKPPPNAAPPMTPEEIDAVEREIFEEERRLANNPPKLRDEPPE